MRLGAALLRRLLATLVAMVLLSSPLHAQEAGEVERLLTSASKAISAKEYVEANKMIQQVLLLEPENARAFYLMSYVHFGVKNAKEAMASLQRAIELEPRNINYSLTLAGVYERAGQLDKAMDEYQRIIDTGTRDAKIKEVEKRLSLATGRSLLKRRELNAALLIFNGLLLDYPDDPKVLFSISGVYMALNRVSEAEGVLKRLLRHEPDNLLAYFNLATIYERTRRPQLALDTLMEILKRNKPVDITKDAKIRHGILDGQMKLARKDWQGALNAFQRVVDIDPQRTEALFNIAIAYLNLRQTDFAEKYFLKVLEIQPANHSSRLNLGMMYYDMGRVEEAKQAFEYIIKNDETGRYRKQAEIRMNIVFTAVADKALQAGNIEESLRQYEKALDYFSGNVRAAFNRGLIFVQQKNFEAAAIEFEAVVKLAPDNLLARLNLANIYEQLLRLTDAAIQYEAILKVTDQGREAEIARAKWKTTKARGLWGENKLSEAEALLEEIVAETSENLEAWYYLAVIQSAKGKLRDSATSLQKILDQRSSNQQVRMMLAGVYVQLKLDELAAREYRTVIFSSSDPAQVKQATQALEGVEARLNGFDSSMSYIWDYDSNINLNNEVPASAYRSDLAFNVNYGVKIGEETSLRLTWSPTYSNYKVDNPSDYYNNVMSGSMQHGTVEETWNYTFSRTDRMNLQLETPVSNQTSLNISQSLRSMLPAAFDLAPEGLEGENIPTSLSRGISLRSTRSFGGVELDSVSFGVNFQAQQSLRWGLGAAFGYTLSIYRNLNSITLSEYDAFRRADVISYSSKDYEYNSHTFTLTLSRILGPGLSGYASMAGTYTGYINNDTSTILAGEEQGERRQNALAHMTLGLNYSFIRDVSFFLRFSHQEAYSTMGTGYTVDTEEAIATFQSTSLGSYRRSNVTAGMNMIF